jgi:hypothetical protein
VTSHWRMTCLTRLLLPSRHQEKFDFRCVNKASWLDKLVPSNIARIRILEFAYIKGLEGRYSLGTTARHHTEPKASSIFKPKPRFNAPIQTNPHLQISQSKWPNPPPRRRPSALASPLCSLTSAPSVSAWRTNVRWNRTCAPTLPSRRSLRPSDDAAAPTDAALKGHHRQPSQSCFISFTTLCYDVLICYAWSSSEFTT